MKPKPLLSVALTYTLSGAGLTPAPSLFLISAGAQDHHCVTTLSPRPGLNQNSRCLISAF